jgi:hypothetical protein
MRRINPLEKTGEKRENTDGGTERSALYDM